MRSRLGDDSGECEGNADANTAARERRRTTGVCADNTENKERRGEEGESSGIRSSVLLLVRQLRGESAADSSAASSPHEGARSEAVGGGNEAELRESLRAAAPFSTLALERMLPADRERWSRGLVVLASLAACSSTVVVAWLSSDAIRTVKNLQCPPSAAWAMDERPWLSGAAAQPPYSASTAQATMSPF